MDNYRQFTFIVPVNTFYLLHFITKRFFYFYFLDMVEMPGAASKNSICYNIPKRLLLYSCASFTNTSWPIHLFLHLCLGKRRLSLIILLKSSFLKISIIMGSFVWRNLWIVCLMTNIMLLRPGSLTPKRKLVLSTSFSLSRQSIDWANFLIFCTVHAQFVIAWTTLSVDLLSHR